MTVSRRDILKAAGAGTALAALGAAGAGPAAAEPREVAALQACREFMLGPGARKPFFAAADGSTDAAEHARNDVLFWSDQLMEHGLFLAMLLPGDEAADLRRQALDFQAAFQQHFAAVQQASVDQGNFR